MTIISTVMWEDIIITCRVRIIRRLLKFALIIVSIDIFKLLQASMIRMLLTKNKFIFCDFITFVFIRIFALRSSTKWIFMMNLIKWFESFDSFFFMKHDITAYSLMLCIEFSIPRIEIDLFNCLITRSDILSWSIFRFSQVIEQSKSRQFFKSMTFLINLMNALTYWLFRNAYSSSVSDLTEDSMTSFAIFIELNEVFLVLFWWIAKLVQHSSHKCLKSLLRDAKIILHWKHE